MVLPRGTRVTLRVDLRGTDGYKHKAATVAVVRGVSHHTYFLQTPSGRQLEAQRDQIKMQREDLLPDLGCRQWDWRRLKDEVVYSAVVGSHAWGLANEQSDEDIRGCFVAPFEDTAGLWDVSQEVQDPAGDASYWEVQKFVEQGLRGDANTLETLWSPLVRVCTPLGESLVANRRMFVSMNILGSFGRYAQSQFKKIERSRQRDTAVQAFLTAIEQGTVVNVEQAAQILKGHGITSNDADAKKEVHAACRSLFDRGLLKSAHFESVLSGVAEGRLEDLRPADFRPKNAYNLLRLLHSCISWMKHGEPLITVQGELREKLLNIKERRVPIEEILHDAEQVARELDEVAGESSLPEQPDYESADAFLKKCRRQAARDDVPNLAEDANPRRTGTRR